MATTTTRRISQPNPRHRGRRSTGPALPSTKQHRAAARPVTTSAIAAHSFASQYRAGNDHRLRSPTRASTAARTLRPESESPRRIAARRYRLRSPTRATRLHCPDSASPRSPSAPLAKFCLDRRSPIPQGVKLIYGSAIKTSRKGRRISKLLNSNRR